MHNFPRRLSPNLNSCVVYSVPPNTLITNTSPAFIRINVTGELHNSDVVGPIFYVTLDHTSFRFDTGYIAKHQFVVTTELDSVCTMTPFDSEALSWDDRIHAGVTNLIASDRSVQSISGEYFTIPSR